MFILLVQFLERGKEKIRSKREIKIYVLELVWTHKVLEHSILDPTPYPFGHDAREILAQKIVMSSLGFFQRIANVSSFNANQPVCYSHWTSLTNGY